MVFLFLTFLFPCVILNSVPFMDDFRDYQWLYNRTYKTAEEKMFRYKAFYKNMDWVADAKDAKMKAQFGMTNFTDWTHEELTKYLTPIPHRQRLTQMGTVPKASMRTIDKRGNGVNVRTQKSKFDNSFLSLLSAIEGTIAMKNGGKSGKIEDEKLKKCIGNMENGEEMMRFLSNSSTFPPNGKTIRECGFESELRVSKYKILNGISQIEEHLDRVGPVVVDISLPLSIFHYQNGLIETSTDNCTNSVGKQTMALVGIDSSSTPTSWILLNTWSVKHGENGFIRWTRDTVGNCILRAFGVFVEKI